MNIIAVDDENLILLDLRDAIKEVVPECTLTCFRIPEDAFDYAKENQVDIAFLDISMPGMDGLTLAKHLKNIYEDTNIIFVTGYAEYALDAYAIFASGFLVKPIDANSIREAMDHLNRPVKSALGKKLRVQTFGNFEVFVNGKPLTFPRSKTKEMLAYLIYHNGAFCNNNEIVAILWENEEDTNILQSNFRNSVADLSKTLEAAGVSDAVIKRYGKLAIVPAKISCDLYDYNAGNNTANYKGEFMAQYSWAETRNAFLLSGKNE